MPCALNLFPEKNRPFGGRVIFDHLPKSAGIAITAWLQTSLGTGVVTSSLNGVHEDLIRRYGGEFSIISGHIAYTGGGMDPRYLYVTCLREPVDRVVSWLFFVVFNHRPDELSPGLHEAATRFIDSEGDSCDEHLLLHLVNPYLEHLCSIDSQRAVSDAKRIEKALSVLEGYEVWGLYEEMTSFLADFSALLGIAPPIELARLNVTHQRPKVEAISPKFRARLNELTALDQELYRQAKARYAQARTQFPRHPAGMLPWQHYDRPAIKPRVYSTPGFFLAGAHIEPEGPFYQGEAVVFKLDFSLARAFDELEMGVRIFDSDRRLAFGTNTTLVGQHLRGIRAGRHQVSYFLALSLPEGDYTAGFAFTEPSPQGNQELASFDHLLDFRVNLRRDPPCAGYVSLPTNIFHHQSECEVSQLVTDGRGNIELCDWPAMLPQSELCKLPVILHNRSNQDWHDLAHFPLALSYHWINQQDEIVVFDGHRTPLPNRDILAGQSVSTELNVETPSTPGLYRLLVLPVIDNQCWMDAIGFTTSEVILEVVSSG